MRRRPWLVGCSLFDLLALSTWVGGLVVIIAAVIPAVFNSFGMEPGGRFLTRVFDGYNRLALVSLVLLGSSAVARWWLGGGNVSVLEGGLLLAMSTIALLITFLLGPNSVALQERAFAAQGEEAKRVAYGEFFAVHQVVRALYVLNLAVGVGLLALKARRMATP